MQFFVGNATKQILQFAYRLPERRAPITRIVHVGRQEKLSGNGGYDLSRPDVDAILEQWGKYGLIPTSELESNRREFQGYLYSIDKPIPAAIMFKATKYREEVLLAKGKAQRQEAALEMINAIERNAKDRLGREVPADQYEVSVVEEEPRGGYSSDSLHVAEGWRATRDQRPNMPEPPSGRRRAA